MVSSQLLIKLVESAQVIAQVRILFADEPFDMNAETDFIQRVLFILHGRFARAQHQDVLEVESMRPHLPEHQAHEDVFSRKKNQGEQIKTEKYAPGEFHKAENEKQGGRDQNRYGSGEEDSFQLP